MRFYKTPQFVRSYYPSLLWDLPSSDSIYLTFDDGPHPEITPWVLDQLAHFDAKATFFCLGEQIRKHPHLLRQIHDQGHQIGNHTYHHLKGWHVSDQKYIADVDACDQLLNEIGLASVLFRPPYGRIKKSQIRALSDKKIIMWSHLSWDFDSKMNLNCAINKLKKVTPGSIIVFHDSSKAWGKLAQMLPEVLSCYREKGFKIAAIT